MHVSLNLEFTHDELEKFAAGVVRRAITGVVQDFGSNHSDRIVDLLRAFMNGVNIAGASKPATDPFPDERCDDPGPQDPQTGTA